MRAEVAPPGKTCRYDAADTPPDARCFRACLCPGHRGARYPRHPARRRAGSGPAAENASSRAAANGPARSTGLVQNRVSRRFTTPACRRGAPGRSAELCLAPAAAPRHCNADEPGAKQQQAQWIRHQAGLRDDARVRLGHEMSRPGQMCPRWWSELSARGASQRTARLPRRTLKQNGSVTCWTFRAWRGARTNDHYFLRSG
jgi:hypothetical protein